MLHVSRVHLHLHQRLLTACTQPGLHAAWPKCNGLVGNRHAHHTISHAQRMRLTTVTHAKQADEDADEEEISPGKPMRVERLLANLGYGKRRDCQMMVKQGVVTRTDGSRIKVGDKVTFSDVLADGEPLDPPPPLAVLLHKPVGYVVTAPDDERVADPKIYDLLPPRFSIRRPFLSAVGRLDKETSGLLMLTDDGQLVHRINSPKKGIWKIYEAQLARPLVGPDADAAVRLFASGTIMLDGDYVPLLPAKLEMTSATTAQVAICEGRYHQVRRMFAAVGNEVVGLHRSKVGGLTLDLPRGEWRYLSREEVDLVFAGPSAEDVLGAGVQVSAGQGSRRAASQPDSQQLASKSGSHGSAALVESGVDGDGEGDEGEEEGEEMDEPRKKQAGLTRQLRALARPTKVRDAVKWAQRRAELKKSMPPTASE